jgi:uncharacterized protein
MIPQPHECFQLMRQYGMLENIREHSIMVARVADYLASGLLAAGKEISMPLIVAGALLHDIGKTQCLYTDEDHARLGREICETHRYHELAPIVGEHVVLKNGVPRFELKEKQIVYYADKRVTHDRIVSLEQRLDYILERYGNDDPGRHQAIERNFLVCKEIEQKIFLHLEEDSQDVAAAVFSRQASFSY